MAIQSSGQISLQDIRDEFEQTGQVSLSEYYRNAGLVDSDQTGVPVSGPISFSDLYGVSKPA